jgi:hypothetical protein
MLKEAIADAKTIKDTAIANAKAALEESFTPHIKDMLSAKLQEMDKDEDLDEGKKEDSKDKVEEMDAPSYDRKSGESLDPTPAKVGQTTIQEEEKELDEMLAELESEIEEGKEIEESKEDSKDELKEDDSIEEADEDEEGEIDVEDEGEISLDDEEIDLEDMSEDDLKGFIEDVIKDMVSDGELEPGDDFDSEEGEEEMDADDMEIDVDADVEIAEELELDEAKGEDKKDESIEEASKKEDDKIEEAKDEDKEVKEALEEVEKLRAELNEVNLLNAKLLYTNKLFRAKNLSEAQKVKVLESFDNATTVKETKLVFDTLSEGIKSAPKKSINEVKGSASKVVGSITKTVKQPIVESNDMVARFQKLAGIAKN